MTNLMPNDSDVEQPVTVRERRERLWIAKLERLPCYRHIVKRLVDGQSVSSIALWARSSGMEGELKNVGLETWRKYITALAFRVRATIETSPEIKRKSVEELIRGVASMFEAHKIAESNRKLRRLVETSARELDSEKMLKACLVIQLQRTEKMIEREKQIGMPLPSTDKNMKILLALVNALRKIEFVEALSRIPRGDPIRGLLK